MVLVYCLPMKIQAKFEPAYEIFVLMAMSDDVSVVQSLCCLHTQSNDVNDDSNPNLDLQPH